jgi:DNA-binding MarR family transcriptional regulator
VQSLEKAGLASRTSDPIDRRASILDLTPEGQDVLTRTREHRRRRLEEALADWTEEDRESFGNLLGKFNNSMDKMLEIA